LSAVSQTIKQQHDHALGVRRPVFAGRYGQIADRAQQIIGHNVCAGLTGLDGGSKEHRQRRFEPAPEIVRQRGNAGSPE